MDQTGAAFPKATVTVLSWNKASQKMEPIKEVKTNDGGRAMFSLVSDKYDVLVSAPNFRSERLYLSVIPERECALEAQLKVDIQEVPYTIPEPGFFDDFGLLVDGGRLVPDLSGSRIPEVPVKPFLLPKKRKARH
jgi:hypothetical protein